MNTTFSTISKYIVLLSFFCIHSTYIFAAEECALSDTSASPLQNWKENIDTMIDGVRKEADRSQCDTSVAPGSPAGFAQYVSRVVPLSASIDLMQELYSLSSLGSDFYSEVDAFLDQSGPLMELKSHTSFIEEIERDIMQTGYYVGSRCAGGVKAQTNILGENSSYDTTGRSLSEITIDMAKQTKEVKRFFQVLSQGIQTEEYIDEVPFPIAKTGFSKDMYVYFSPKHIQECRDNNPRKKAFLEVMKGAFTSGWKYPQAIQVWKDAMALLLYRGSQLIDSGTYDESKEAQINSIVQARKGGIGNSDVTINSQFFKEFGYRPKSQTMDEKTDLQNRKSFYERIGYSFVRKVLPGIVQEKGADGYVRNIDTQLYTQKIERFEQLDISLYSRYNDRKQFVASEKESAPFLSSDLAKVLERHQGLEKLHEKTFKNICSIPQAENVPGKVECNG